MFTSSPVVPFYLYCLAARSPSNEYSDEKGRLVNQMGSPINLLYRRPGTDTCTESTVETSMN